VQGRANASCDHVLRPWPASDQAATPAGPAVWKGGRCGLQGPQVSMGGRVGSGAFKNVDPPQGVAHGLARRWICGRAFAKPRGAGHCLLATSPLPPAKKNRNRVRVAPRHVRHRFLFSPGNALELRNKSTDRCRRHRRLIRRILTFGPARGIRRQFGRWLRENPFDDRAEKEPARIGSLDKQQREVGDMLESWRATAGDDPRARNLDNSTSPCLHV